MWKCFNCGRGGVPDTHKCKKADIKKYREDDALALPAEEQRRLKALADLFIAAVNSGNVSKAALYEWDLRALINVGLARANRKVWGGLPCGH